MGSISSLSEASSTPIRLKSSGSENGELDYKKLYEESQVENDRLKDKLKRSDEQLKEVRSLLEKAQTNQNKVILSEAEKRERRAMERKLSEMEEELKVSSDCDFPWNIRYLCGKHTKRECALPHFELSKVLRRFWTRNRLFMI